MKWSELKRASDTILAVWPHYRPLHERWFMQELVDKGECDSSPENARTTLEAKPVWWGSNRSTLSYPQEGVARPGG